MQHEELKHPVGTSTKEEPKWEVGLGPGNGVSGSLSSLAVPAKETAANAWGATKVPQPPTIMDWDGEFAYLLGLIVFSDSPPANPQTMNPLPATTSALATQRVG